jgi:hypothetical protein
MPDRTACKFCGKVGFVRHERVIKGGRVIETFYCGACNRSWEETEEGAAGSGPQRPRDDKPKR